jgi:hypothetical protein
MNRDWVGKRKFIAQFHVGLKASGQFSRYGKVANWQKLITSKLHRSVK